MSARGARPFGRADFFALAVVVLFVGLAIPGLGAYPIVHEDEAWIAAPGYGFWTRGVFATDLFRGLYGSERHMYDFMPLFSLVSGGCLRLFGLGLWQVRVASVASAAAVLLLTHLIGRSLLTPRHGLLAVLGLAFVPLAVPIPHLPTGIPMADLARLARYDVAVPVGGLLALWVLAGPLMAEAPLSRRRRAVAGFCAGLAMLTHVYGALSLAVGLLWTARHARGPRRPWWMVGGFAAALIPWALFVASGWRDFLDQQRTYTERFAVTSARFYLDNVLGEVHRYGPVLKAVISGRPGALLLGLLLVSALVSAARRPTLPNLGLQLLLEAVAVVGLGFAVLLEPKTFTYLSLLWPLLALWASASAITLWERPLPGIGKVVLAGLAAAALASGVRAYAERLANARRTTPYSAVMERLARGIPAGSRVLALPYEWLGLADRFPDCRSLIVPVSRWDPRGNPRPIAFDSAVDEHPPDVVIIDPWLRPVIDAPEGPPIPDVGAAVRLYLERHGAVRADEFVDPSYGRFETYVLTRRAP